MTDYSFLEDAERNLTEKAQDVSNMLELVKAVRGLVLPGLEQAIEAAPENVKDSFIQARIIVTLATGLILGTNPEPDEPSVEPDVKEDEIVSSSNENPKVFGINQIGFSLIQSLCSQDELPGSLAELARQRWGIDWKSQQFWVGNKNVLVSEEIAKPEESRIGRLLASSVYRIEQFSTNSMPKNTIPHKILEQAQRYVERHGIEQIKEAILSWGIAYPPQPN